MANQHSCACCHSLENHAHSHNHEHSESDLRRELMPLSMAVVLFIIGLIWQKPLHNTPYALAEYAVFIPAYLISG